MVFIDSHNNPTRVKLDNWLQISGVILDIIISTAFTHRVVRRLSPIQTQLVENDDDGAGFNTAMRCLKDVLMTRVYDCNIRIIRVLHELLQNKKTRYSNQSLCIIIALMKIEVNLQHLDSTEAHLFEC